MVGVSSKILVLCHLTTVKIPWPAQPGYGFVSVLQPHEPGQARLAIFTFRAFFLNICTSPLWKTSFLKAKKFSLSFNQKASQKFAGAYFFQTCFISAHNFQKIFGYILRDFSTFWQSAKSYPNLS